MQLNSEFSCNSVIWISSLPSVEMPPTIRMVDATTEHSSALNFNFEHVRATSKIQLLDFLDGVAVHARDRGTKPLIHFDTHGNKRSGIYVDGDKTFVDWETLAGKLQTINIHTKNNLAVVGATCFGLHAIKPISFQAAAPFFLLLAPDEKVSVGFLEDNVPNFYRDLFKFGSIEAAYSRHLSDEFRYFHCEKMLFIVIARYLREQCMGKGGAARRERLITEIMSQGMESTPENLKRVRKMLKEGFRPDQSLVDRYAERFLIGRKCSFNVADLESFIAQQN